MSVSAELLDSCSALQHLQEGTRQAIARVAHQVEFRPGERLVALLKPPSRLLIPLRGLAKMVGVSQSGVERILYVFRPCEVIGARVLRDDIEMMPHEIIAMDPVTALSIGKPDLMRLGRDHPDLLVAITQDFSRRLNNLTGRMLGAMSAEVPVRLSKLLLDFATSNGGPPEEFVPLDYPLTHEAMAQIIGASRPHTSTVLRDLEELGAVRRKSDHGLLVRVSRLTEIVSQGI